MKFFFTSIIFVLLTIILPAQNSTIRIEANNNIFDLNYIVRNEIEYISLKQFADGLKINSYFNPSSGKFELKFNNYYLKFTAKNQFVIITSRSDNKQEIVQLPISTIYIKDDVLIPLNYSSSILEKAYQSNLKFKKSYSTITERKSKEDVSVTEKKDIVRKSDITGIDLDVKTNGTLIKVKLKKKSVNYSHSIENGILFLNLPEIYADESLIKEFQPKGLIKKISIKQIKSNAQIVFHLNEGYSTSEVFRNEQGNDLLLTVHNKLLSNSSAELNKYFEKWNFDVVVIDAGHGGKDPGAIGINGAKEKDINLAIALKLGSLIEKNLKDIKVVYTRSSDKFVELYKRGKIANENNGNLFISIHCNSTPKKPTNASGFEVYLLRPGRTSEAIVIAERENSVIEYEDNPSRYQELTDENFILVTMAHSSYMRYSEHFSDLLNRQFSNDLSLPSNGIKQAGFYVLVGASMPNVLIETGFLSNKKDAAFLISKKGQEQIAASIFKAVKDFKESYDNDLKL